MGLFHDRQNKWKDIFTADELNRLSKAAGLMGEEAAAYYPEIKDIGFSLPDAARVFITRTLPEYRQKLETAFPGAKDLPPLCYGAMLSIVYNRGASLKGDRRREMKAIHDAIIAKEYQLIPDEIRKMKRLWINTSIDFLVPRRESEARICDLGLAEIDLK